MVENITQFIDQSREFLKYALVVLVIIVISLLFPTQPQPISNIQAGDSWNNEDLIAQLRIEIPKSAELIESERAALRATFSEVFVRDLEIQSTQTEILQSSLNQFFQSVGTLSGANISLKDNLLALVDSLYNVGIVIAVSNPSDSIRLFEGDSISMVAFDELLQESDAEQLARSFLNESGNGLENTLSGYLNPAIQPNIIVDPQLTSRLLNDSLGRMSQIAYVISKGELLAETGEILTVSDIDRITAYQRHSNKGIFSGGLNFSTFIGYLLLTCLIIGALLLYVRFHFNEIFDKLNTLLFVLIWPVLFSFLVYSIENTENITSYIIPFCIVPIVVKNFFSERLALFLHIVIVLIASFLSELGYEFTFLLMLTGIVTVLVVQETRYWNKFFNAILIIFSTYILGYLGLSLIQAESISDIHLREFGHLTLAALLTLLAYPFIPLLERLFGFTSSISLAELSDMSNPLLKEMSIRAPGTMQHSIQVANLSEAAADKIGANSLLIKVGALYHDIGKLSNPEYFIENQAHINPHESISYFESAKQIIRHVGEGEKMAKKAKLPQVLVNFIMTHHGTTRVEYFYRKQLTDFPEREFDETLFRYPGPKPKSKEEAILMMADSLEASSKSLKSPAAEDIEKLVETIISEKIKNRQFEESRLSFSELEQCKEVFKSLLRSIYHVRIEYPESPGQEEE